MMKHFLFFLLCVGVCVTSMAGNPRFDFSADVVEGKILKKDFGIVRPFLPRLQFLTIARLDKNVITPQTLFTQRNCNPNDNLMLKKAPKRLSNDDLLTTKIAFLECYQYNDESGEAELSPCYYDGGWDVYMEQIDDGVYYAYLYYEGQVPVTINADLNSHSAELVSECIGGWQWTDTTSTGSGSRRTYTVTETTEYVFLVGEDLLLGYCDDYYNLSGTIYNDGSIYFPDGFAFYIYDEIVTTTYNYNWVIKSQDTDEVETISPIYRDTYLMTPNATHDYDLDPEGAEYGHSQNNVYMYQYDDSTVVVWNLWSLDGRGNFMYIHDDGTMTLPAWQAVGTTDVADLEEYYPEYDWSEGYEWVLLGYDEENDTYSGDDLQGNVTPDCISWGASQLIRYCILDGSYYAVFYNPLYNNQLTFTNGEQLVIGASQPPTITSEVFDEYVMVFANATAQNGYAYLFDENGNWLDNPYYVPRTTEDQELLFMAIEVDEGRNQSEIVMASIFIPAIEAPVMIGDLNDDGTLSLQDVTMLVDLILSGNLDGYPSAVISAADTNQDGMLNLDDVNALMELIVNAK